MFFRSASLKGWESKAMPWGDAATECQRSEGAPEVELNHISRAPSGHTTITRQ